MTQNSADSKPIGLGIAGLGMAGAVMVHAAADHPDFILTAAADPHQGPREAFARDHNARAYADVQMLVRDPAVSVVYVATPHQYHAEHAVLAAEHGKHIILEKPMALTLADCDVILAAVERHKVHLIVGHTHAFDPAVRLMRDIIARGELGKLGLIHSFNYTNYLYRPRRPEELDTAQGGGILFNQIPHQVDIARLLAGAPLRSVRAMTGMLDPSRPTEGCCMAFLDFANGAAASLVYSGYDRFDSDELYGWVNSIGHAKTPKHGATRQALLALNDQDAEIRLRGERYGYGGGRFAATPPTHQPHFGTLVASYQRGDMRPTPGGLSVYTERGVEEIALPAGRSGRTALIDELCDAVVAGQPPIHDGRFAKGTVEACLAILRSARERREIVL
jgi:phthalate 4,5-cis-dihydrodiol dehydrogenase